MSVTNVAYVVNMFPKLSETFIANEIAELVRRVQAVARVGDRLIVDDPSQHRRVGGALDVEPDGGVHDTTCAIERAISAAT